MHLHLARIMAQRIIRGWIRNISVGERSKESQFLVVSAKPLDFMCGEDLFCNTKTVCIETLAQTHGYIFEHWLGWTLHLYG